MAMLGDLIAAARKSAGAFHVWLRESDPELADQVDNSAMGLGVTPASYARMAIADFTRFASEEDWATITSSMRDTSDPGTVCLLAMVHWRLTARGCANHSHSPAQHEGAAHG